ncbi:MAG: DUF371 domain-containing protein [Nanoarchaeota archaeon]|nr:DUF371 domain-containing protein [Nanoarchaeota archaeon]MBU1445612.1 DUF371 domain-containing protein [Nanoarchaeota archaeon]MBU2406904.1 DUF371 domain-containing protein [Nanoarchaeota archaeon]MBU2420793.1 DUF371 domain-containing protein [Nanoarchaeota archaeon]MBU2475160.1 DUF371 domain-containing protein [Nanoarchaeota archaeon]
MKFIAYGHENVLGTHKTTLEFTKDDFLSKQGDCILGIKLSDVPSALSGKVRIQLKVGDFVDEIEFIANEKFKHSNEFVIRKSDFLDDRTFGIHSNKAACDIKQEIIEELKKGKKIEISLHLIVL